MNVIGFVGASGSGKTTLIERLIAEFRGQGLAVAVIKQARPDFTIDYPGKDSDRFRLAGAADVVIASGNRYAVMHHGNEGDVPAIKSLFSKLSPVDLVLVEGFSFEAIPKILVSRGEVSRPAQIQINGVIAMVSDKEHPDAVVPTLPLNSSDRVARFIRDYFTMPIQDH